MASGRANDIAACIIFFFLSLPLVWKCVSDKWMQKWELLPKIVKFLVLSALDYSHYKPPFPPTSTVQCSEQIHPPLSQICADCVWFIFCAFDVLRNAGKERSDHLSKNLTVCVTICPQIHRLPVNQMRLWIAEVFETALAALPVCRGESTTGFVCNLRDALRFP